MSNNTAATLVAGTLLATCAPPVLAELGPAFTGMTGRADDASAAFFSPAGITRLERPEVGIQTMFVYAESRFDVDEATFEGGRGSVSARRVVADTVNGVDSGRQRPVSRVEVGWDPPMRSAPVQALGVNRALGC